MSRCRALAALLALGPFTACSSLHARQALVSGLGAATLHLAAVDSRTVEQDDIATYRAMTPEQRLALALELSALAWKWLDVPDAATGDRKLAAWQREHDLSNAALLEALVRHARACEP